MQFLSLKNDGGGNDPHQFPKYLNELEDFGLVLTVGSHLLPNKRCSVKAEDIDTLIDQEEDDGHHLV